MGDLSIGGFMKEEMNKSVVGMRGTKRAEAPRTGRKSIKTYGAKRVCYICGAYLSVYNKKEACSYHYRDAIERGEPLEKGLGIPGIERRREKKR